MSPPPTPPPTPPLPWPGWPIALGALARGAALWLLVRALVGVVRGSLWPTVIILAIATIAALIDARRRRLPIFLANLGVPAWLVVGLWLLPVALLELSLLVAGVEFGGLAGGLR